MATKIWDAAAATPTGTHRIPADTSAAGSPTRYTVQQLADLYISTGVTAQALGNVTGATAISLAAGGIVTATATGNTTFSITNPPTAGSEWVLILTNGGAHTITWFTTTWAGGTAPTLTASGVDVIHFATPDGGTTWYGSVDRDEPLPTASTTVSGIVELAIASEVSTGTDTSRAMTVDSYKKSTPFYVDRTADWTLALTDVNADQWFNNGASALVCTIPLNATVAFAVGDTIPFVRLASGTATIDAATSVTLNGVSGGSCALSTRYQGALLKKIGTDSWVVSGDVSAVA